MSDKKAIVIFLIGLVLLDLLVIGGVLWKGHANFIEVYKNL